MSKSQKSILQVVVFLLIAAGLIYWQYTALDEAQLAEIKLAFSQTKWHYLFIALMVGMASHIVRALRWRMLLQAAGSEVRMSSTTVAILLGYLVNALIPRMGEIVRCTTLVKTDDAPFEKSLGTVISERVFDTFSLLLLFIIIFISEYSILAAYGSSLWQQFVYDAAGGLQIVKFVIIIGVGLLMLLLFIFIFKKIKRSKVGLFIQNMIVGLQSIFKMRKKGVFLFYSVLMWILYVLMVWVAIKAVPNTAHLGLMAAAAITAFGSIAIIFTPGGIGAYPPIAATILTFYGVSFAAGTALGWVAWTMQTVVVLVLGLISLVILPMVKKKREMAHE